MKISRIVLGIVVLLVPIVARSLWFYQGVYHPSAGAAMPDFSKQSLAFPELSTPLPTPKPAATTGGTVLFDQMHGNLFTFSEITPLLDGIQSQGAKWSVLEMDEDLRQSLKRAESFVVIAPTLTFTAAEIEAVKDFVGRGGRLLVFTDPTRDSAYFDPSMSASDVTLSGATSTAVSNLLLNPFDLSFMDDYLYNISHNEGNFRHVLLSEFAKNPLTAGLKQVVFYSAHSLQGGGQALVSADGNTFSSRTDAGGDLAAAALSADGKVAAIGDLTFLSAPYVQVADNQKFISNLAAFLVNNDRTSKLADFPYLFKQDVAVRHAEDLDLSAQMVSQLADLQDKLRADGLSVDLSEKDPAGADLLVIGVMPPGDDLQDYLKDFDLTFSEDAGFEEDGLTETPDGTTEFSETPTATPSVKITPRPTAALTEPARPLPTVDVTEPVLPRPTINVTEPAPTPAGPSVPEFGADFPSFESFDGLDSSDGGGTVEVPNFGKLPVEGLSLILFQPGKDHNTVILLAASKDAIPDLLGRMNAGDLSGCLIKGNVAVCGNSTNGGFSGGVG